MEDEHTLERLVQEYQSRAHLSSYQLNLLRQFYAPWIYAAGFNRGMNHCVRRGKRVKGFDGVREIEFDTVVAAAKAIRRHYDNLRRAIRNGRRCGGYYWKYI